MPRPPTFGNAVVRYFSTRLLPDPPAAGGRLTEYVTRNGLVIVALAALVLIGGAWYLFAGDKSAPGGRRRRTPGASRGAAVVTAHPARKEFAYEVEALGTLRANESVDITAKVADRVAAIHFDEGQQVRKGERADRARQHRGARRSRRSRSRRQRQPQPVQAQPGAVRRPRRCRKRNSISCRRRCSQTRRASPPRARGSPIASSPRRSTAASGCAT